MYKTFMHATSQRRKFLNDMRKGAKIRRDGKDGLFGGERGRGRKREEKGKGVNGQH